METTNGLKNTSLKSDKEFFNIEIFKKGQRVTARGYEGIFMEYGSPTLSLCES